MIINDKYAILLTEKGTELLYKNGDNVLIDAAGIHMFTHEGKITIQTYFPLCGNGYYGPIRQEFRPFYCHNCIDNSQWRPLNNTYCRKCGRKLTE